MVKSIVFILTLLLVGSIKAATNHDLSAIHKVNNFKIQHSRKDEKLGRHIIDLYSQLRKKRLKISTTSFLANTKLKNTAFSSYKSIFIKLDKIARAKSNFKQFHKACSPSQFRNDIKVISFLSKKAQSYCRNFFVTILSKNKKIKTFSQIDLDYLKLSLPYYLKGESRNLFIKYLNDVDENSPLHILLSKYITSEFIHKKIKPHPKYLTVLSISDKLTSHIQAGGLNDYSSTKYFKAEFRRQRREFNKKISSEQFRDAKNQLKQMMSFYEENQEYIPQKLAWKTFISSGKKFLKLEDFNFTEQVFKYTYKISSDDYQKNESDFHLIWRYIVHEQHSNAVEYIEKRGLLKNYSSLPTKTQFWISYSVYKNNELSLAKYLFKQITTNSSALDYYSILSTKVLHEMNYLGPSKKVSNLTNKPSDFIDLPIKFYTREFKSSLKRLQVWLELDYDRFANMEIATITSFAKDKLFKKNKLTKNLSDRDYKKNLLFGLIKLFNNDQQHLHSFKLIYSSISKNLMDVDSSTLKYLFPFEYIKKIKKIDKTINPLLVISLIRQESAFNPKARSHVGARGLMQLMPGTARMFKRHVKSYQLKNPDLNLTIGIKYFKKLLKMFDGNLIHVLASYNAGENRIKRWKKTLFISKDPLVNIELIPYKETRMYVKLIYRNLFFYNLMSNNPQFSSPLRESFQVSKNYSSDIKR